MSGDKYEGLKIQTQGVILSTCGDLSSSDPVVGVFSTWAIESESTGLQRPNWVVLMGVSTWDGWQGARFSLSSPPFLWMSQCIYVSGCFPLLFPWFGCDVTVGLLGSRVACGTLSGSEKARISWAYSQAVHWPRHLNPSFTWGKNVFKENKLPGNITSQRKSWVKQWFCGGIYCLFTAM